MKTLKYSILSLALIFGVASCDFLDKTPYELTPETFFKNDNDVNYFLIGVYSPLMQETFYGNNYAYTIAGGDDLSFYQRENPVTGGSVLCANANSTTTDIATYWRVLYDGINRTNMLLEGIDNSIEVLSPAVVTKARAEALFMRSFYYFNLVQGWGDVPLRLKAIDPVNPIKDILSPRVNKQTIYDRIISDIEIALPDLPDFTTGDMSAYVTKSAAQGILARIYLFRAGEHYREGKADDPNKATYLDSARYWAYEVIKSNIHGLVKPYERIFLDYSEDLYNSTGVNESIWEVVMAGNRINSPEFSAGRIGNTIGFGSKRDYSEVTSVKGLTGMKNPGYSYRFIYASLKLYDLYETEKDNARSSWNIAPFEYTEGTDKDKLVTGRLYFKGKKPAGLTSVDGMPCTEASSSPYNTRAAAKYRREYEKVVPKNKNYTPINFPILRYSDVLLMYAEAENELNGPANAKAYLKLVRERAEIDVTAIDGYGQSGFREAIKRERAMELCFEGTRRWDLVRWGQFYTTMRDMVDYTTKSTWDPNHRYAAGYYKVSPAYVYFPIPDQERGNNPMSQNTGW